MNASFCSRLTLLGNPATQVGVDGAFLGFFRIDLKFLISDICAHMNFTTEEWCITKNRLMVSLRSKSSHFWQNLQNCKVQFDEIQNNPPMVWQRTFRKSSVKIHESFSTWNTVTADLSFWICIRGEFWLLHICFLTVDSFANHKFN